MMDRHIYCFRQDCAGKIALEAALIVPWLMLLSFILVLFIVFVGQSALLYYTASIHAERTAFNWGNTAKDPLTGAYPEGQYDPLYWRLLDNGLLQALFGLGRGEDDILVTFPTASVPLPDGAVPVNKLNRGSTTIPGWMQGTMQFHNRLLRQDVTIRAEASWDPVPLRWLRQNRTAEYGTTVAIIDPAELLRTFEFARYYARKIAESPDGEAYKRDASRALLAGS